MIIAARVVGAPTRDHRIYFGLTISRLYPAITNPIYAATGKRLRKLPIDTAALKQPV